MLERGLSAVGQKVHGRKDKMLLVLVSVHKNTCIFALLQLNESDRTSWWDVQRFPSHCRKCTWSNRKQPASSVSFFSKMTMLVNLFSANPRLWCRPIYVVQLDWIEMLLEIRCVFSDEGFELGWQTGLLTNEQSASVATQKGGNKMVMKCRIVVFLAARLA